MVASTHINIPYTQKTIKHKQLLHGKTFLPILFSIVLAFFSFTNVQAQECDLTLTPINIQQPTCGGSDGSFAVQVGGITPPYQYTLSKEINGVFVQQQSGTQIAGNPLFLFLSAGTYRVTVTKGTCTGSVTVLLLCPEVTGNEGCSPGYWKNHPESWVISGLSPTQTVESVFDVPDAFGLDNTTLMQALQGGGGSGLVGAAKILLRAATAALLNAAHPGVDYPLTTQQIITDVNTALSSGNRKLMLQLAATLDNYNNLVCPINAHGEVTSQTIQQTPVADLPALATELNLKALPNPSAGAFNIQIESGSIEKINIRVIDMQGRLIEQRQNLQPNQTLKIGDSYRPGVYLLEVQQGATRKQLKLIKAGN